MSDLTIKEKGRRERSRYFAKRAMDRISAKGLIKRNKKRLMKKRNQHKKATSTSPYRTSQIISLPEKIGIHDDTSKRLLVNACKKIRSSRKPQVFLDFSDVKKIYASGMLLLYAEVYQKIRQNASQQSKILCNYPTEFKSEKVLQHIGFLKMLGAAHRIQEADITEDDIVSWHVAKDVQVDGSIVGDFIKKIPDISLLAQSNIYVSLQETIANVCEHAYPVLRQDKTWIMFGRINEGKLIIVVGDLGDGIPHSITKDDNYTEIVDRIKLKSRKLMSDTMLIMIAAAIGRTSAGAVNYRGRGLEQSIKKITDLGGEIFIYSGKGVATFPSPSIISSSISRIKRLADSLQNPIRGTIIEMRVPLQNLGKQENEKQNNQYLAGIQ